MVNLLIKVLINSSNTNNIYIQALEWYLSEMATIYFIVDVENISEVAYMWNNKDNINRLSKSSNIKMLAVF